MWHLSRKALNKGKKAFISTCLPAYISYFSQSGTMMTVTNQNVSCKLEYYIMYQLLCCWLVVIVINWGLASWLLLERKTFNFSREWNEEKGEKVRERKNYMRKHYLAEKRIAERASSQEAFTAMPVLATNAESETGIPKSFSNELPSEIMEEIEHTCPQPQLVSKTKDTFFFLFCLLEFGALWGYRLILLCSQNRNRKRDLICVRSVFAFFITRMWVTKQLLCLLHSERESGIIVCFCNLAFFNKKSIQLYNRLFL